MRARIAGLDLGARGDAAHRHRPGGLGSRARAAGSTSPRTCGWCETEEARAALKALYTGLGLAREAPLRHYVASRDGAVAGMASAFSTGDAVVLAAVAVLPAARRRGVGRALALARLREAREHGCELALLSPTPDGSELYETLAFESGAGAAGSLVLRARWPAKLTGVSIQHLTGATEPRRPEVCRSCVWWQGNGGRAVDKRRWIQDVEDDFGAWGEIYLDGDRHVASLQYGPAPAFPRARTLPGGPGLRRRGPRDVRVPLRPVEPVVAAEPLPGLHRRLPRAPRDGDRGLRASCTRPRPSSPSASSTTARSSRATSSPTTASRRCAAPGRVELMRLELGGLQPVDRGRARRAGRAPRRGDHHRAAGPPRARAEPGSRSRCAGRARGGVPVRLAASAEGDVAPERHHHSSEELASCPVGLVRWRAREDAPSIELSRLPSASHQCRSHIGHWSIRICCTGTLREHLRGRARAAAQCALERAAELGRGVLAGEMHAAMRAQRRPRRPVATQPGGWQEYEPPL